VIGLEYTDEQLAQIRDSIMKLLPVGASFILIFDNISSEEFLDSDERNVETQDFVRVVGKYQSPFVTRGLLEAASDSYRFNCSDYGD
jgi:hypothetical protein